MAGNESNNFSRIRQKEIYSAGASGKRPVVPISFNDLEVAAKGALTPEAFAYIAGGAGLETTMKANRDAFASVSIVPRMLRDVSQRDTSVELFGHKLPSPFLLAPIGVLELAHPEADLAVAKAAAAEQIPMIFSNQASCSMEDCSTVMADAPRWFQLYWSTSNDLVESFVRRAEASGCSAIVVTLDTTLLGWRPRDLSLAYLPFLKGMGIAQYTSDPVFNKQVEAMPDPGSDEDKPDVTFSAIKTLLQQARKHPGGTLANIKSKRSLKAVRLFIESYSRPSLTWQDLGFLRELTDLPILLKGILHPADALKAMSLGVNGLVVSNHGGRQLDGAISSIRMLPSIVRAVGDRTEVWLDSGIRSGQDILKAMALGAKGTMIGRSYVYGLGAGGEAGVTTALEILRKEFDISMALCGRRNIEGIDRDILLVPEDFEGRWQ